MVPGLPDVYALALVGAAGPGPVRCGQACRQDTASRAPPRGESPTSQRPPVDRTTEFPMARPRPAPDPCSVALENRSNSRDRWSAAIPGPLSSTVSAALLPLTPT